MKITYFYQDESEKEYFSEKLEGFEIEFLKGTIQENSDYKDDKTEIISVFVKSNIGVEEMDKFPNLKLIATRSTGFNHIDLEEAKKRNIAVSNVPAYGENTVAEFAFALLLALSRKIYTAYNNVLERGDFSQKELKGFDLKGKTIGIVGGGNIGKCSIKIAKGFDMNVIVFDVRRDEDFAKKLGFEYVEFDELLQNSDIISLHVPLNPHTQHLINRENISKIKKGTYLINTSRGEVVETVALVEALEKGILAGAGLDVLEEEEFMGEETGLIFDEHPNPEELKNVLANQYLIDHPQVIITPHNAFNTKEAVERIFATTVENIQSFGKGNPVNLVDKS
ncbi:hydroxyacid dehydrogenase [Patescibacteria group bacterium]|nr:hydroxyacid dehydrogenase [Patescibacteria group bacterium]MCG2694885.1 NAD(P)-binding domain-containing protein [Candidatus Parcubacteria bacterium]